jgi:nitrogen fixation protein NifZ
MSGPGPGKYRWGQRVRAAADLFNDGSFPDQPVDALLARAGESGEIVQVGAHVETDTPIYLVRRTSGRRLSRRRNHPGLISGPAFVGPCPSNQTHKGAP